MVFWPDSPRVVTMAEAEAVVAAVPDGVLTVGVFVDPSREQLDEVMRNVPLGAIQLHGRESADFADSLPWPIIKAVAVPDTGPLPDLTPWSGVRILIDAHDPVRRGGTGHPVDWARAAALAATRPVILAGGLRPETVGQAIARVRPAGIDVSSGVEAAPGIKDAGKLRALFDAVREVEV
jgi:phosphoribosylanthranilate isomerase